MTLTLSPTRAAMLAHLSSVAAVIAITAAGRPSIWAGLLAFLGPLVATLVLGRGDAFTRAHASEALRFNLSIALYLALLVAGTRLAAGSPYTVQLVPFALFLNLALALNWLMFTLIAAHRAATGQLFTYPLTLRIRSLPTFGRSH